ncbi:MAG: AAA family ATPase [Arcobacter sp.]|uniref:AAA family ATPase n=1 Tax=Arcobacter sp. TaxID=1872629 RepID=UPI003C795856
MSIVSLNLPKNVLHNETQVLEFDKISTFIGGNGSGKSTILKSIFDEKLKGSTYQDYKIVCFSSGQNESYSKNFGDYLNTERAKRNALNLDCFYYDKLWSMLLIFLATTSKQDGEVRTFLKQNNYIHENDFEEDESTKLSFDVKVDDTYANIVQQSLEDEAKGKTDVITNKDYFRTLNNFITTLVKEDYEFKESFKEKIQLDQNKLSKVSFERDEGVSFDPKVMFFTQAADNNYFIVKESFELIFEKDEKILHLSDLSDGEYQLLFLYSLIDLFDSEKTLFLLDEADSHLHYKNIEKLWNVYNKAQGSIITTTHLLDSIVKAGIERLKVIEDGQIKSGKKLIYLTKRLKDLSEINNVNFQAISWFKNVVLIDDENDWEIFKLLVQKKMANSPEEEQRIQTNLNSFIPIKNYSGYKGQGDEVFGYKKLEWTKSFTKFLSGHSFKTKNIFMICDRDELPLASIGTEKCNLLLKNNGVIKKEGIFTHLLAWRRREIKHYLLSYTALKDNIKEVEVALDLGKKSKLLEKVSGDNTICGNYNDKLSTIKSDIVKDIVDPYINKKEGQEKGFSIEMTKAYVDKIPKEEISEDIVNMYNYLVGENE